MRDSGSAAPRPACAASPRLSTVVAALRAERRAVQAVDRGRRRWRLSAAPRRAPRLLRSPPSRADLHEHPRARPRPSSSTTRTRRYADLDLERSVRVLAAERTGYSVDAHGPCVVLRAASARWLALWMAFDDVVLVADLKIARRALRPGRARGQGRRRRRDRDRRSLQARRRRARRPAAAAPRRRAGSLGAPARRTRPRAGPGAAQDPQRDGVRLPLLLRGLAATRALRRHGSRFAAEQAALERWLVGVEAGARRHAALGARSPSAAG